MGHYELISACFFWKISSKKALFEVHTPSPPVTNRVVCILILCITPDISCEDPSLVKLINCFKNKFIWRL